MDDFAIVPVEVLSMMCRLGGVQAMKQPTGGSGNSRLHEAWQLAVTRLEAPSRDKGYEFSLRDVQHIKKFRNLETMTILCDDLITPHISLPGWQLVSQVAPALSKLKSICLEGPSSFEVLKVLQSSEVLQQRITALTVSDFDYFMTAADCYTLASMKALKELALECEALPEDSSEALAVSSQALAKTLESLKLHPSECPTPAELQAFPGSITSLQKLQLMSDDDDSDKQGRALAAAVSSLVGLQDLELRSVGRWTAEQQRQALGALTCLTRLALMCGPPASLLPLGAVPMATLQELRVQRHNIDAAVADAVFGMAAVRVVHARSLQPSAAWRGKVAAHCGIQELYLHAGQSDEDLCNMPRLPHLRRFSLIDGVLASSDGRYLHLARLLQRHAATLQHVTVSTLEQVREALPDLPVCKVLKLWYRAVGPATLRVLGDTQMPLLEELSLYGIVGPEVAQLELSWLAELPALKKVVMGTSVWTDVVALQDMVRSALESKPLVVVEVEVEVW